MNNSSGAGPLKPSLTSHRLLVVDDDPDIRELLAASLRYAGFEVSSAEDGQRALDLLRTKDFDIIVIDVMMPEITGLEVVRRLRASGKYTPVLFLTARDSTEDKVAGLTVGGDDYVTKPFSPQEVVARIHSLLRRSGHTGALNKSSLLSFEDIELDQDSHQAWKGKTELNLSPTEFKLLAYFLSNPGRVLSKSQILDHVWEYDFGGDGNVVESYVSYLRKKVDNQEPRLLHTVRGVGYVLRMNKGSTS